MNADGMGGAPAVSRGVIARAVEGRFPPRSVLVLLSALVFVLFLGAWELIVRLGLVHRIILPPPGEVGAAFWEFVRAEVFAVNAGLTLMEIVVGFAIGSAAGFGLGLLHTLSPTARAALYPYVVLFQATPRIVFAPIIITWFGFGPESKIVQAALGSVFAVFINTVLGLTLLEEDGLRLMRSLTANRWQVFAKLRLPAALPSVFAGLKIALTFAMIGAIVSEMVAAEYGLGLLLTEYQNRLEIAEMFAVIVTISLIGLALFLLIDRIDRKVVFWHEDRPTLL